MKIKKNRNINSFLHMLATYKKKHIIAMFFSIVQSVLMLFQPIVLMNIIDKGIMQKDLKEIAFYICIYLGVVVLQNIVNIVATYLYSSVGKCFIHDLRVKLLKHIQKQSGNAQSNFETGELFAIFDNDIDNMEEAASNLMFSIFSDILVSICMCIFLLYLQADLFFIIVLLQPIMFVIQKKYKQSSHKVAIKIRELLGEISKNVQEFFAHITDFVKLNAASYFWNKYEKNAKEYLENSVKLDLIFAKSMSVADFISCLTMCTIFGYGGYKIVIGKMSIGGLISFNQYALKLFSPILKITQYNIQLRKTMVSIDKVFGLLGKQEEVTNEPIGCEKEIVEGNIKFKDVYFSYDGKRNIYQGLNLNIIPGEFNGIVGESGEGKSTIINLLMRLWDVQQGAIIVDGLNIKRYSLDRLRKSIALVTQEPFLVNDTIRNNMTLLESVSEEDVIMAAKQSGIYDFIISLPNGFNTRVGENGVKLSGGQKQRIAIARILLRNTPIVILDEATAALDNNTEEYIIDKFYETLKGRTVIIISHRLSIIKNCAYINVLRNGSIVESGSHEELLLLEGYYKQLYDKIL